MPSFRGKRSYDGLAKDTSTAEQRIHLSKNKNEPPVKRISIESPPVIFGAFATFKKVKSAGKKPKKNSSSPDAVVAVAQVLGHVIGSTLASKQEATNSKKEAKVFDEAEIPQAVPVKKREDRPSRPVSPFVSLAKNRRKGRKKASQNQKCRTTKLHQLADERKKRASHSLYAVKTLSVGPQLKRNRLREGQLFQLAQHLESKSEELATRELSGKEPPKKQVDFLEYRERNRLRDDQLFQLAQHLESKGEDLATRELSGKEPPRKQVNFSECEVEMLSVGPGSKQRERRRRHLEDKFFDTHRRRGASPRRPSRVEPLGFK